MMFESMLRLHMLHFYYLICMTEVTYITGYIFSVGGTPVVLSSELFAYPKLKGLQSFKYVTFICQ